MAETKVDIKRPMDDLPKEIDELERRVGTPKLALILKLLDELEVVHQMSEQLRVQLVGSETSRSGIPQQFNEVRQGLERLRVSLHISLPSPHRVESSAIETEGGNGNEKKRGSGQDKKIQWWKISSFFVAYVAVEVASNALANQWSVDTLPGWLLLVAIFLIGCGINVLLGRIPSGVLEINSDGESGK